MNYRYALMCSTDQDVRSSEMDSKLENGLLVNIMLTVTKY